MPIFGHSKFLQVFLYQKDSNKFGMHIFGHSEFLPVFLGKIVRKNSEQPFLAILNLYHIFEKNCWKKFRMTIPNLYQSLWEKLSEKIWNSHFWPFQIYTSLFGKIVRKNSEWPFLAILNLYQFFWEKLSEKIYTSPFGKRC